MVELKPEWKKQEIIDELQKQIDYLKLPTTTWVRHVPDQWNQACAVVRVADDTDRFRTETLSPAALSYLIRYLREKLGESIGVGTWNDYQAKDRQEVMDFLRQARDALL